MSELSQPLSEEAERVRRALAAEVVARVEAQSARGFEALTAVKGDDRVALDGAYGLGAYEPVRRAAIEFLSIPSHAEIFHPRERAMIEHEQADGAQGTDARVAENMPIDLDRDLDDEALPPTEFENQSLSLRRRIKAVAAELKVTLSTVRVGLHIPATEAGFAEKQREDRGEMIACLMLAYRHLEDASMRIGKAIQASNGGTSVYDRDSTVGA